MEFNELLKSRHSAVNFVEGEKITREDFKKIFELSTLAPSAFNLQPTKYLVIDDHDLKERIFELAYRQYKIHTASAVVLVLGQLDVENNYDDIYMPLKMLGAMDEDEFNDMKEDIFNMSNAGGLEFRKKSAVLNSAVHATTFMYAAKDLGFDTCPMYIQNFDQVKEEFNIPDNYFPVMMITIGKSVDKTRKRGYRKVPNELVVYNKF